MTLSKLLRTKGCLAVSLASAMSMLSYTVFAEAEIMTSASRSATAVSESATPVNSVEVEEQGDREAPPVAPENAEVAAMPPNFSDLQSLRDFDHNLVDFTPAPERSYKQSFKDEVLAFCISSAYHAYPEVKEDALYTAAAFHSWSRYELEELLHRVPPLVMAYLDKPYREAEQETERAVEQSPVQPPLQLLKCLDLYHSPELEDLANAYVIDPDRSYAEDHSHIP